MTDPNLRWRTPNDSDGPHVTATDPINDNGPQLTVTDPNWVWVSKIHTPHAGSWTFTYGDGLNEIRTGDVKVSILTYGRPKVHTITLITKWSGMMKDEIKSHYPHIVQMTELLYEVSKNLDPLPCLRGLWGKDKYFGQKYESPARRISSLFYAS